MNRRPSRFVLALARWALMAGLAGIVLSLLAVVDRWRAPANLEARHNLLIVAAVLLSLSFVLAPFVRRAFVPLRTRDQRGTRKTLLDEMREHPDDERSEQAVTPPSLVNETNDAKPVLTRVIVALYIAFGAVLAAVVLALR